MDSPGPTEEASRRRPPPGSRALRAPPLALGCVWMALGDVAWIHPPMVGPHPPPHRQPSHCDSALAGLGGDGRSRPCSRWMRRTAPTSAIIGPGQRNMRSWNGRATVPMSTRSAEKVRRGAETLSSLGKRNISAPARSCGAPLCDWRLDFRRRPLAEARRRRTPFRSPSRMVDSQFEGWDMLQLQALGLGRRVTRLELSHLGLGHGGVDTSIAGAVLKNRRNMLMARLRADC